MIALASTRLLPHWITCPDCHGWFDPLVDLPVNVLVGHWLEPSRVVCLNCATLLGFTTCDDCTEVIHEHDAVYYGDSVYCYDCAMCNGITQCADCDKWINDDYITDCYGEDFCEDCRDTRGFEHCESCDEWHDDITYIDLCGCYCSMCFTSNFAFCSGCEEIYELCELTEGEEGDYCSECLDENCSNPNKWVGCAEYDLVGSSRRYGVELETHSCGGWQGYNHPAWIVKDDVSISGMEFVTSILCGNEGIKAIKHLSDYAKSQGWSVNDNCGYHLHIDISKETADSLKAVAFAYHVTYDVWKHLISMSRWDNWYCKPLEQPLQSYIDLDDINDWRVFSNRIGTRNQWVNWGSFNNHSSLEIRIHEGTLDCDKVCNWIRAHTTFCDWAVNGGCDKVRTTLWGRTPQEKFGCIRDIWADSGCYDLTDFYACDTLMEPAYA